MIRRISLVLAAAGLAITAVASPASAQTKRFEDRRGDADEAIDITRVKVKNAKGAIRVKVVIPQFRRSGTAAAAVTVKRLRKPRTRVAVSRFHLAGFGWSRGELLNERTGEPIRCKGDRVRFTDRGFAIRIPQRCLPGKPGRIRAAAYTITRDAFSFDSDEDDLVLSGPDADIDVFPQQSLERVRPKLSPAVRYR
ncbi:hypothetical protein CLV56_0488 [Mumia flava]|uniref:Uncharacterized protein n=1 Tax=Mumia flava TaxID=1348852 RepID=A0A0B2BLT6_9ACTN|nr:hypothetical protein [Mumia flava]PJJ56283.1 hypothetical protein CLV56_0488 [Mumia flava]